MGFWEILAVAFPLGLAPKAPGTFGSLMGIPVGALIFALGEYFLLEPYWLMPTLKIAILVLLSWFAWYAIKRTEASWQTHDDGRIVIDEVVGQAIPLAFLGYSWKTVLLSFVFFRFFDIVKPGPIGWADRSLPGAWGTLCDDLIAGVFALPVVFYLLPLLERFF